MAKFFIDVVRDSPRTGLGIPVKTCLNFTGGFFQPKVAYDSSVIRSPGTSIRGYSPVWQTD